MATLVAIFLLKGDPALFQIIKTLGRASISFILAVPCKLLLIRKCVAIFYDFFMTENYFVNRFI